MKTLAELTKKDFVRAPHFSRKEDSVSTISGQLKLILCKLILFIGY